MSLNLNSNSKALFKLYALEIRHLIQGQNSRNLFLSLQVILYSTILYLLYFAYNTGLWVFNAPNFFHYFTTTLQSYHDLSTQACLVVLHFSLTKCRYQKHKSKLLQGPPQASFDCKIWSHYWLKVQPWFMSTISWFDRLLPHRSNQNTSSPNWQTKDRWLQK